MWLNLRSTWGSPNELWPWSPLYSLIWYFYILSYFKPFFKIIPRLRESSVFLALLMFSLETSSTLILLMANLHTYFDISVWNSLQHQVLIRTSFATGVKSWDTKYIITVFSLLVSSAFIPLVVENLGLWTDTTIFFLHCIAACTTPHSEIFSNQALHNVIQQLLIKLSYNDKKLLQYLFLLPMADPLLLLHFHFHVCLCKGALSSYYNWHWCTYSCWS